MHASFNPAFSCMLSAASSLALAATISILLSAAFFLLSYFELSDISCILPLILHPLVFCQLPLPLPLLSAFSILLSAAFFLGPFIELSDISCILPLILLSVVCYQLPLPLPFHASCLHSVVSCLPSRTLHRVV
jgi:hypothetical protein